MEEEFGKAIRLIEQRSLDSLLHLIATDPSILHLSLTRSQEFFSNPLQVQFYAGDSLLHIASAAHFPEIVSSLIENGASVESLNRRKSTPLHYAAIGNPNLSIWSPEDQTEVIKILIENGAEVDGQNLDGITPLHKAIRNRCALAVQTLLEKGANPNLTNKSGSNGYDLIRFSTGRGGSGTDMAKGELFKIKELLNAKPEAQCQT